MPSCKSIVRTFFVVTLLLATPIASAQQMGGTTTDNQKAFADASINTANQFVIALNERDVDFLVENIDTQKLGLVVANALLTKKNDIEQFMLGFASDAAKKQLTANLFGTMFQDNYQTKFVRMLNEQGTMRPLLRVDYDGGGNEYMILHLSKEQKMYDVYLATSGKLFSENLIQATGLMLSSDKSILGRLFDKKQIDKDLVDSFKRIAQLRRQGDFLQAYRVLRMLPAELQDQRTIIDLGVLLSQYINDEEYMVQLKQLAKYYGDDPSTQFMLVDYYVMNDNHEKVMNALNNVVNRFGIDGALADLIANAHYNAGEFSQAIEAADKGISVEQDFEGNYWTKLTILVETRDYEQVSKCLNLIESNLGYEFTQESLSAEPMFSEFVASSEFKKWLASKT